MIVQSSLNDVFKFVQFRPPIAIDEDRQEMLKKTQLYITIAGEGSEKERRRIANAILQAYDKANTENETIQEIGDLKLGSLIYGNLEKALAVTDATVATFADLMGDVRVLVGKGEFQQDIHRFSDTLLMSAFATQNIPVQLAILERLYLAYFILEKVVENPEITDLSLSVVINQPILIPFANPWLPSGEYTEPDTGESRRYIRSVGIGDLLVVKQQIMRYDATEIAHVENIMAGETRSREHRHLVRFEETLSHETESTQEQKQELETTERYEMNRETSRTIKEDQKYDFNLSISGKYGSTVEFSTGFDMSISRSEETSAKSASTYARDIVNRSMERIEERVRQERIRKILRETEETNLHSFENRNAEGLSGIYQFLDKIFLAQVFNYGKREMFDLMIPEPASYLWYLDKRPRSPKMALPKAPVKFDTNPFNIKFEDDDIDDENHYTRLATRYNATGINPPPDPILIVTGKHDNQSSTDATGSPTREEDHTPYNATVLELKIPNGYRPANAQISITGITDVNDVRFFISLAGHERDFNPTGRELINVRTGTSWNFARGNENIVFGFDESNWGSLAGEGDDSNKLHLSILAWESANYTITCQLQCVRTDKHLKEWQLELSNTIMSAYQERLLEHQDEVSRIMAEVQANESEQRQTFGVPPSKRQQIILTELKKHCISIFTEQWYNEYSAVNYDENGQFIEEPPQFNLQMARLQGNDIRFFEQAFEWDQMQYAFYPYFWANKFMWADRFQHNDPDYNFQQFMQAGAARVVLPVRPGFETAVNYYLQKGKTWAGRGEPPSIGDPLYVSIVDEIRERTGGRVDAIPVGEPWEVRLPTNMVLLRQTSDLPAWEQDPPDSWEWRPKPT